MIVIAMLVLVVVSLCLTVPSVVSVSYPARILPSSSQCGHGDLLQDEQLLQAVEQQLAPPGCLGPRTSCKGVLHCNSSATSGYYMIQAANGSSVQVYCDMEGTNCGGEGGWMRVAYLKTGNPSTQCPEGFRLTTSNSKKFCTRNTAGPVCRGMEFEALGLSYTQVCGQVRGYKFGTTDAFDTTVSESNSGRTMSTPVGGNYVDGVSITYSTTPLHIWTYAAGLLEYSNITELSCPCNSNVNSGFVPSFVGNDYYCESTNKETHQWHTDDPLWDGQQCGGAERPCCNITGLPWFNKIIPSPTTDSIVVRVCVDQHASLDNIGIEELEIYTK